MSTSHKQIHKAEPTATTRYARTHVASRVESAARVENNSRGASSRRSCRFRINIFISSARSLTNSYSRAIMIQVTEARNATRSLLLTCCSVHCPNVWHQKLVGCAQQIETALDRVDLFDSYLLRATAEKLAAITKGMKHALHVVAQPSSSRSSCESSCDSEGSAASNDSSSDQSDSDADLALALRQLWQVYIELALAIKVQEVTTPALKVTVPRTRRFNSGKKPGSPLSKSRNQNDVDFYSCRAHGISDSTENQSSVVR
ncbi:hypothetical protein BSKO_08005 [Bryopsis sp. KO-2023]|nr:hypothetical protein BSKO_08005 [Bryopsis sp. KO-2023]